MIKKGLILALFLLAGCNSLPVDLLSKATKVEPVKKDVVPDEMKIYAKNVLDYGDYYMKEFAENSKTGEKPDSRSLVTGFELIVEEIGSANRLSKRMFPKLEEKTLKVAKQCYEAMSGYSIKYGGLPTYVMVPTEGIDLKTEWDKVIQSRAEMIKDCQL
jgi:hypothetical protein